MLSPEPGTTPSRVMQASGFHPGGASSEPQPAATAHAAAVEGARVVADAPATQALPEGGVTLGLRRKGPGSATAPLEHAAASEAHLAWVVKEPLRHGRWLNTLALLEHIGCRKIVKSMDSRSADLTLLRHIAEEARHALFFKELACRVGGSTVTDFRSEQLMCGDAARAYIQRLDHEISDVVSAQLSAEPHSQLLPYLCVTRAVEVRAVDLYRRYEAHLRAIDAPFSLRSILLEEDSHLEEMDDILTRANFDWDARGQSLSAIEARAFAEFLAALAEERGEPPSIN